MCFKVLGDLGLLAFFPIIIAGDTLPFRKPDGRVLENTIQLMGLERHSVLFVGDSSVDFETAKNADVRFIYFEGGYGNGVAVEACYRSFSCYENFIGVIGLEG